MSILHGICLHMWLPSGHSMVAVCGALAAMGSQSAWWLSAHLWLLSGHTMVALCRAVAAVGSQPARWLSAHLWLPAIGSQPGGCLHMWLPWGHSQHGGCLHICGCHRVTVSMVAVYRAVAAVGHSLVSMPALLWAQFPKLSTLILEVPGFLSVPEKGIQNNTKLKLGT